MRFIILLLFTCSSLFSQNWDQVQIKAQKLSDNFYMLKGAGGNIGLLVGDDGTVMIDDQYAPLSDKILAVVDSISNNPVRYVVNTHWHGDHTGGNENLSGKGATIIAHENVRERLMKDQISPFRGTVSASPEGAWPTLTFSDNMKIHINDLDLHLIHVHNAHTDGDAFVYLPEQNILHLGDCYFKGRYPYIDLDTGGSPLGLIAAIEAALMMADDKTQIIPGHGTISNRAELDEYYQMLKIMTTRIQRASYDSLTLEEIDLTLLDKEFPGYGDGFIKTENFVKMLFRAFPLEDVKMN